MQRSNMAWKKQTKTVRKNPSGFLLFELLIVIALIGILTSLVSAPAHFLHRALVRAEIEKLYTICCYLNNRALVNNQEHTLTFDTHNNSYSYENTTEHLPKNITFGGAPNILGPPSNPHKPIKKGVTFPHNKIIFYPTGIVHAGTVYISDTEYNYTYALSCAVSQFSYLRKYMHNKRWELIL